MRIPKRALVAVGALLTVLIGALAARLIPTRLLGEGYSTDANGVPFGFMSSYEPTPVTTYVACAVAAGLLYALPLLVGRRRRA